MKRGCRDATPNNNGSMDFNNYFLSFRLLVVLLAGHPVVYGQAGTSPGEMLWYEAPAADWMQALPIGNGRLGGMVLEKWGKSVSNSMKIPCGPGRQTGAIRTAALPIFRKYGNSLKLEKPNWQTA